MLYYPLNLTNKGGKLNASLLCKMPQQEGDERSQIDHHEEWKTGDPGIMSELWDQDVPDWEGITLTSYVKIQ